jgi:hypothetical protein
VTPVGPDWFCDIGAGIIGRHATVWEDQICVSLPDATRERRETSPICDSVAAKGILFSENICAKGDTKNVIATSSMSPSFAMFGSSGRAYQSIGFAATTDGVHLPGMTNGIKLTDAYCVRGAFNHKLESVLVVEPLGLGVLCAL